MPRCSALFNHEFISVDGKRLPCCRFSELDSDYTVKNSTIKQYHNSKIIHDVRNAMEYGWHSGCNKCKLEEETGLESLRNLYNLDHSFSDNIESIEFSLSNKCNLICRMCNPVYSSKWNTFLGNNRELESFVSYNNDTIFSIDDVFTSDKDLSELKFIKYLGGEPFITPEIYKLFELLDEQNLLEKITFFCTTNATFFPDKYVKYLKKFKFIRLDLSLDGTGSINEYIRYGKSWDTITNTIDKWLDYKKTNSNIDLSIFTTVQAYNIHDINNLKLLSSNLGLDFRGVLLSSPTHLSVNALTPAYIEKIKDSSNEDFLKEYQFSKSDFKKLKQFTSMFDKGSSLEIKNIIPDLWRVLENEKF